MRAVGGVDVERLGYAIGSYFYGFAVVCGERAIFGGGGEEVDDGEGELFLGVVGGCL